MDQFKHLFTSGKLGKKTAKNRIFMAPMGDVMANPDGSIGEQYINYYAERAKGGAAVIIPGVVSVDYPYGKTTVVQARLDEFKYVKGFAKLATQVHRYDSLLIPQIHHAGGQTYSEITEGNQPFCVSADIDVEHALMKPYRMMEKQRELTTGEIHELVQKYIKTAKYCQLAGCDGVEVHGAHGYLINQFLSRDTNAREDEYGGSLENRMRFGVEIVEGIRAACGPDFILAVRIPGFETVTRGLTQEECVINAQTLEKAGCDYLHVSCGCVAKFSQLEETQGYEQGWRVKYATNIKNAVSIPVVAVGAIREPEVCEELLTNNKCDFIALGRPLICDPYFGEKAKAGKSEEIRKCISCMDGCIDSIGVGHSITCTLNPEVGYEKEFSQLRKVENPKNVVIVGGGPAGMEAAIYSAKVGHKVTLLEQSNCLGGQLNIACVPPNKESIRWAMEWQIGELKRQNVEVRLNFKADVNNLKEFNPEMIYIATGAVPCNPPIPGIEHGIQSWDILDGKVEIPEDNNVVVIGGGIVGCEVASLLLKNRNKVTIIEMLPEVAATLNAIHRADMMDEFAESCVDIKVDAAVKKIEKDSVVFEKENENYTIAVDKIILAMGQKPHGTELYHQLCEAGLDAKIFGDAKTPAKILNANKDAFWAVMS